MKRLFIHSLLRSLIFLIACSTAFTAEFPMRREWNVDGVTRAALVYVSPKAKTEPAPVIFAFHGHGGTMQFAARNFRYHQLWPEAIVVYMQGLNTPGGLVDPEGKRPGWQMTMGAQNDRDLKFFDMVLASLQKEYRVDEKRMFATGHSNGGVFTYVLWAARGERFAAVAPCAAVATGTFRLLKPKPVLHLAGEKDPLVKFTWQQLTMQGLRQLNQCGEGHACAKYCEIYESKIGSPVVTYIHPGGHEFPMDAAPTIVKFFKEHTKQERER